MNLVINLVLVHQCLEQFKSFWIVVILDHIKSFLHPFLIFLWLVNHFDTQCIFLHLTWSFHLSFEFDLNWLWLRDYRIWLTSWDLLSHTGWESLHHTRIELLHIVWFLWLLSEVKGGHLINHWWHHVLIETIHIWLHHIIVHVHTIHVISTVWHWHSFWLWHTWWLTTSHSWTSKIIITMGIGAFISIFAWTILFIMTTFNCLEIGATTSLIILIMLFVHELATSSLIESTSSTVILTTSIILVVSSHSHSSPSLTTSESTSLTTSLIIELHSSSALSTSTVIWLEVAVLLLNRFQCNFTLLCGHWVIRFSELSITMSKMASITKTAITMLFIMSAFFSFVLLINLGLLLLSDTHTLALTHTSHHVLWELILLFVATK